MEEKVYFTNSKGDKLCGILSNPTGDKTRPIIISSHGFGSNKNSSTYTNLQSRLNDANISVLRFDFFGHGESEGKFEDITISEGVDDILGAIKFLKQTGYSKIGLLGSSFGGICSIMAASKVKDLYILVLKSPVSDYTSMQLLKHGQDGVRKWREGGYIIHTSHDGKKHRLNYTFFDDFKNNDAYASATRIEIPALIVHGDQDEVVPIEQSKKTCGLIKGCRLEIIEGLGHHYTNPAHFEKFLDLSTEFIKENS